jgi:hypothetical protein
LWREVKLLRDFLRSNQLPRTGLLLFWDVFTCAWRVQLALQPQSPAQGELTVKGELSPRSNTHKVTERLIASLDSEIKAFFDRRKALERSPKNMLMSDEELSLKAVGKRPSAGKSPRICMEFLPPSEQIRKLLSKILKDERLRYAGAPEILVKRPNAPTPMVAALDLTTRQLYITTDWQWQNRTAAKNFEPKFLTHKFYLSKGQILARLAPAVRQGLCQGLRKYQEQVRSGQSPIGYDHYGRTSYFFEAAPRYSSKSDFIPLEEL